MALTQEQVQRLRQMAPADRQAFHLNRIATSLEAIEASLKALTPAQAESAPRAKSK